MDNIYLLKQKIESAQKNGGQIGSMTYEECMKRFITLGRVVLGDESLTYEDISNRLDDYVVATVKTFLSDDVEQMYEGIKTANYLLQNSLMSLEKINSIIKSDSSEKELLLNDETYQKDREFYTKFDEEDLNRLESLQSYIKSLTDEEPRIKM